MRVFDISNSRCKQDRVQPFSNNSRLARTGAKYGLRRSYGLERNPFTKYKNTNDYLTYGFCFSYDFNRPISPVNTVSGGNGPSTNLY